MRLFIRLRAEFFGFTETEVFDDLEDFENLLRGEILQMEETGHTYYDLALTNKEVRLMFENMIQDWFSRNDDYNDFIKELLQDDVDAMNEYMNRVAFETFSYFDTGRNPSRMEPEKFYHGFAFCGKEVLIAGGYFSKDNCYPGMTWSICMISFRRI